MQPWRPDPGLSSPPSGGATRRPGSRLRRWGRGARRGLCLLGLWSACTAWAEAPVLTLGVVEDSAPMSYRGPAGELLGFNIDVARALCRELARECEFRPTRFDTVLEDLRQAKFEVAAVSLVITPERGRQILFSRPIYRSMTVWLSAAGRLPQQPQVRVAVVGGTVQAALARRRGWHVVEATTNGGLASLLSSGQADGMLAPMLTVFSQMKKPELQTLGLSVQPYDDPELRKGAQSAAFGIAPGRHELKSVIDAALERLDRDGELDKISSRYLPFKVN